MVRTGLFAPLVLICLGLGAWACAVESRPPGQLIGNFAFEATPLAIDCPLSGLPDAGFRFSATFSYQSEREVFTTIGGVTRGADFDGQFWRSTSSAKRTFDECACAEPTMLEESIAVALLSVSQARALGGACPANVFEGGVPEPDPARGIEPPHEIENGYDALLACGVLTNRVVPAEGADCGTCPSCTLTYALRGERR